jgi:hypothetical protein
MKGFNELGRPVDQDVLKADVAIIVSHKDVPVDEIRVNAGPHATNRRKQRLFLSVPLKRRKGD